MPIILIAVAIGGFLSFTNPLYNDFSNIKKEVASYNDALGNAKALQGERDKLTQKYNSIDPDDLSKLQKLLPDGVDNIRLILELEKLAAPYGMVLKNVKYDSSDNADADKDADQKLDTARITNPALSKTDSKIYGTWNLEFSTEGTYPNFVSFVRDIESNLRMVDIASVQFSSDNSSSVKTRSSDSYIYNFKIKTYWLKN